MPFPPGNDDRFRLYQARAAKSVSTKQITHKQPPYPFHSPKNRKKLVVFQTLPRWLAGSDL